MSMKRLPDFIVAGASKAGTTSLINYLNCSPDIGCITQLNNGQEPHFFSKEYGRGLDWYSSLFSSLDQWKIVGEKSVSYMTNPGAVKRIHSILPEVKLIFVLRNPIDRAYSQYKANVQRGTEYLSFDRALDSEHRRRKFFKNNYSYLERGYYAIPLNRYYSLFNKDQIHVVIYEEFVKNPKEILDGICTFLKVEGEFIERMDFSRRYNVSRLPKYRYPQFFVMIFRKFAPNLFSKGFLGRIVNSLEKLNLVEGTFPALDEELRNKYNKVFEKSNYELEKLIQKDLKVWRE